MLKVLYELDNQCYRFRMSCSHAFSRSASRKKINKITMINIIVVKIQYST